MAESRWPQHVRALVLSMAREGLIEFRDAQDARIDPWTIDEAPDGEGVEWALTDRGWEYVARTRRGEEPGHPA